MTEKSNILHFPKKSTLPADCTNTSTSWLTEIQYGEAPASVTDFTNGEKRYHRWAATMSLTALPNFDQIPVSPAPVLIPKTPSKLFTADSIPELRARMIYEVDQVLKMVELSVTNPEEFKKMTAATLSELSSEDDMC